MDIDLQELLDTSLIAAQEVFHGLPGSQSNVVDVEPAVKARIQWIERQLTTLAAKLKAMQEDAEAGLDLHDMGFADSQEVHDLLNDMRVQIAQLKAMSLALGKGLGLGL